MRRPVVLGPLQHDFLIILINSKIWGEIVLINIIMPTDTPATATSSPGNEGRNTHALLYTTRHTFVPTAGEGCELSRQNPNAGGNVVLRLCVCEQDDDGYDDNII